MRLGRNPAHSVRAGFAIAAATAAAFAGRAQAGVLDWDADGMLPINGGSGTWDNQDPSHADWWDGAQFDEWNNVNADNADFTTGSGNVMIAGSVTARSLEFDSTGYTIGNGTGTLSLSSSGSSGAGPQTIQVTNAGQFAYINTSLVASALTKTGQGGLWLEMPSADWGGLTGTLTSSGGMVVFSGSSGPTLNVGLAGAGDFRAAQSITLTQAGTESGNFYLGQYATLYSNAAAFGTSTITVDPNYTASEGVMYWAGNGGSITLSNGFNIKSGSLWFSPGDYQTNNLTANLTGAITGAGKFVLYEFGPSPIGTQQVTFSGDTSGLSGGMQVLGGTAIFPAGASSVMPGNMSLGGADSVGLLHNAAVLTSGLWTRDFGTGAGQIQFLSGAQSGSYTTYSRVLGASGGSLTVNFGGKATPEQIAWGTNGFWADGAMELTGGDAGDGMTIENPIALAPYGGTIPTRQIEISGQGIINFTGVLSGPANVQVMGGGTAEFSANNSYAGATIVSGGATLILNNPDALGTGGVVRVQGTGEYDGGGTVEAANGVTIPLMIDAPVGGEPLTLTTAGTGSFQLGGNINLTTTQGYFAGSVSVNGSLSLTAGTHSFVLPSGAYVSLGASAVISGAGAIDSSGPGETFFTDPNSTFSGGVTIESGSNAYIGGNSSSTNGAVTSGPLGTGTLTIDAGASVFLSSNSYSQGANIGNPVTLGTSTLGAITLSGAVFVGSSTPTISADSDTDVFSGTISGSSTAGITFSGPGTYVVSGVSQLIGALTVSAGALVEVANGDALNYGTEPAIVQGQGMLDIVRVTSSAPILLSGSTSSEASLEGQYSGIDTGPVTFSTDASISNLTIENDITDVTPGGATGTLYIGGYLQSQAYHLRGGNVIIDGTFRFLPSVSGPAVNQEAALNAVSQVSSLTIWSGAILDLTDNALVIDYGSGPDPISTILQYIKSGYAGGNWNGTGVMSSWAAANSGSYGIGYADSADPGNPAGLASGTIEIAYTLLGDANLDGKVNGTDFAIFAANFNQAVTSWDQGDFNYDGKVNGTDFAYLAENFNQGASAADISALESFAAAHGLLSDLPEPGALSLVVPLSDVFVCRRRAYH